MIVKQTIEQIPITCKKNMKMILRKTYEIYKSMKNTQNTGGITSHYRATSGPVST